MATEKPSAAAKRPVAAVPTVSSRPETRKFSHTEYDFPSLIAVCETLARQAVEEAGGRIETDTDGEEVFVIPVRKPVPPALEQSWDPGPPADSRFTAQEMELIQTPDENK
mgnify:CR=1 FL=1